MDYLLFAPGVVDMFPKSWQDMIDFDTNNEINLSTKSTADRQSSTSEGDSGESQQDKDSSIGEKVIIRPSICCLWLKVFRT